jgi:hypothetical protein
MRTRVALALIGLSITLLGAEVLRACGDKFLLMGRGPRFQRAYAAIHPASILIIMPTRNGKSAAVRDPNLATALTMAGHKVDSLRLGSDLNEAFARRRYDIILAERADAEAIPLAEVPDRLKPTVVAILEDPSKDVVEAARNQIGYVLATPQPLVKILNALDDIMKMRIDASRRAAS